MTPITVTPLYSGFTTETARIAVDDGAGTDQALAREGVAATSGIVATGADVITGAAERIRQHPLCWFLHSVTYCWI